MTPDRGAGPYGPAGRPPGRRSWAADGAFAPDGLPPRGPSPLPRAGRGPTRSPGR